MLIPKHSSLYNNVVHQLVPLARNGEEILKLHAKVLKNKLTEEKVNKNKKKNDGYFKWKLFRYQ